MGVIIITVSLHKGFFFATIVEPKISQFLPFAQQQQRQGLHYVHSKNLKFVLLKNMRLCERLTQVIGKIKTKFEGWNHPPHFVFILLFQKDFNLQPASTNWPFVDVRPLIFCDGLQTKSFWIFFCGQFCLKNLNLLQKGCRLIGIY